MKPRCRGLLNDIQNSVDLILSLASTSDWSFGAASQVNRLAIERSFEIIGIALNRIESEDAAMLDEITEYRSIIAFRNRIAHGYESDLDASIFDAVVRHHLPILKRDVTILLGTASE
jgi:uncharacterized protein with HEPN domain